MKRERKMKIERKREGDMKYEKWRDGVSLYL
jgi:hypothetical protein